ncbi:MAG: hypothetical protein GX675_03190, partial [Erysipelotrichaceae bacterium]|nr:hypothetical protein [Erysipelotrichaceae bacterium]
GVAWWHKRDGADSNVNESTFNQLVTINHIPKVENDLIIGNAFLTLGLDNFSSIKSITKRTKEIERLLKIDTIPKYDKDIYYLPLIRGHLDVKNAIKNLTDLQNKIIESFFWFDIQDEKDEKNYTLLQEGKIVAACWHWNEKYVQNNDYLALKNLIIAEMMYLTISGSINILRNTLEDWKLIINNEKFWDDFNKRFQDNDEFGTDIQQLRSFKNEVINLLGEYYFRISDAWENDKIITSFISIFGVIPKNLRDTKATPLFKKIYDINKKIHSMYSDDNKSGLTSISNITIIIEKYSKDINDVLSELYRYGLKDDYELRDLCEDSGQAIRNLAINILNTMDSKQYQDTRALAETLLKKSKEYATSFVLQEQIQRDIRDLERQKMLEAEMKKVEIEVKNSNFDNAQKILLKIVETESNVANKRFFVEQLLVLRKAELNQLFKKYIKSKNYFAAEEVIDVMIKEETDLLQKMELIKVRQELTMKSLFKY